MPELVCTVQLTQGNSYAFNLNAIAETLIAESNGLLVDYEPVH